MAIFPITRRRLLVAAGGATAVAGAGGLWLGYRRVADRRYRQAVDRGERFAPSVYLAVESSGDVVIWLTRSEMGQGVATALPMVIAEELDADWARVRIEQAVAGDGHDYGQLFTAASSSTMSTWTELRRAGATARAMLVAAAARGWGVPEAECETLRGEVRHSGTGRGIGYGDLAERAAREWAPLRPALKNPADFRLIGHPVPRLDIPDKVTGRAVFGLDVDVPGMRRAVIARCPWWGGSLGSYRDQAALAVPGVRQVVRVRAGLAVVADSTWAALRGRDALDIDWRPGPQPDLASADISARLKARLDATDPAVAAETGDGAARLAEADATLHADYFVPYLAHAPMEPMNCTAQVSDGRCEVWAPTQSPDGARDVAAAVAGVPREHVVVHTTLLGGGFGRRAASDFVAEAVDVAAAIGEPVQVVWSREDDLRHSQYRDAAAQRLRARTGADGLPEAWMHRVVSATPRLPPTGEVMESGVMGAVGLPYAIPAQRVEWLGAEIPVPATIWRSVGYSYNTFAVECFLDELAHHAGRDPVEYRLALLGAEPRLSACLRRAAEMADWEHAAGSARMLGVAICRCFGSHIALVAEVAEAPAEGATQLEVSRIWCATDCGIAVNPDIVRAQIEGGILFGLSAALFGELTVAAGRIEQGNFDRYRLLRISEAPDLQVELIPSAHPPGGIGEVGVPAIAPAVANAVFAATGERRRRLPLSPF